MISQGYQKHSSAHTDRALQRIELPFSVPPHLGFTLIGSLVHSTLFEQS